MRKINLWKSFDGKTKKKKTNEYKKISLAHIMVHTQKIIDQLNSSVFFHFEIVQLNNCGS